MKVIGVDIGGTKITSALIEKGKVLRQHTFPTPSNQSKMKVVEAVYETIDKVYDRNIDGIGIGVPGLVDLDNGLVLNVINIPSWDEVPLKQLVEDHFNKTVWINNDANCFAIGEKYFGKGQKYQNFVGITIGTGLGGGIIINNHLYSGKYCGAGEFGMLYYQDKTVEAFASGQFFKNLDLEGKDLSNRASHGDTEALHLFNLLGEHIGCAVANILFALAPEAIILGGSVTKSYRFFEHGMRFILEKKFPYQWIYKSLQIEISELQNSSVLGAASLVIDALLLS